ncbi:hypothetical protein BSK59_28765 [Paenibacillus odorifer]|uniref:DEAD/DEAH box helicase n=1 Tax=Paenibacillus odorifer TaxID=189426 RepID=UPI00096C924E|nr:SNF2-related protein [Paenibacillus odorifer]OME46839.1 hypothetical protein BSK59_28765 [Paenibacillus odorifer]
MCNRWLLDYDGGLLMKIPSEITNTFIESAFYKLALKRYVREIFVGFIRFKDTMTYLEYKKVIKICQKEATKNGVEVEVSGELADYINMKELYIKERSMLGIELKQQHVKLMNRFEEYRFVVDSQMSRKLRDKQMWDSFFMCAMQKSGNFSVPGSGKTSSVLGVYAYLKFKELVKRIVVICPKNAFGSWIDEFGFCFDGKEQLEVFNIHSSIYHSSSDRRRALQYESGNCNLFLFNYESVSAYRDEIISLLDANTFLVFDEVHRVKRIEGEYAVNAVNIAKNAIHVVAMTGTPIPNTYLDIYNLLHILFPDEYNEFFDFDVNMLRNPSTEELVEINGKIAPFFCRTTKQQLNVPDANSDIVLSSNASDNENRLLNILKMKYRKNKLALMIRILQLESNPKLLLKTLNLNDFQYILDDGREIDEIDYVDYSSEVKLLIESCKSSSKMMDCVDLIESLAIQGKPVVVWCIFIDSINRIIAELESRKIRTKCIYGMIPLDERQEILSDFKNGSIQILLTNPHTLAESISLHNICHDAVYFEYSYNLVHLLQSKDRIHRLGLDNNQYTQYYFLQTDYDTEDGRFSLDEQIRLRLEEKEQIMLNAIDNNVLESMPTSDEDLELIFSKLF